MSKNMNIASHFRNAVRPAPGLVAVSTTLTYIALMVKENSCYRAGQSLRGFQEVEVPRFQENSYLEVVSLSALRIVHLYLPGNIPGTHFC